MGKGVVGGIIRIYADVHTSMKTILLMASIIAGQITGSPDADAKATAQALVWGLEKCPARVVVAKFKGGWTKNTWGPPTNLDYDVLKTNSIKWPYQIVICYTIPWTGTKDRKQREEAEQDTKPALTLKFSNRNLYQIGDDGTLRIAELLSQALDGSWKERASLPDVCWDHLPKSE
jgi:hypothetical protein